jgi:exopolysaccharide production protein ExoZ
MFGDEADSAVLRNGRHAGRGQRTDEPTEQGRTFFSLIDQLRGIGALLVVYSHLVANFLDSRHRGWIVDNAVDKLFHDPLHAELNFGWPGVVLFFFVSGFVVTHAAARETPVEYIVKRLLRIYPPLIVTALVVALMAQSGTLVTGLLVVPTPAQALLGASLGNYLVWERPELIAVGWTLVIEMFFYLGLWATRPLLARFPAAVPMILLLGCAIADTVHDRLGISFALAAAFVAFVPLLLLGQIVYLVWMRRIPTWAGGLLATAAWVVFDFGMHRTSALFASPANSFLSNAALAFCVFVIAVLLEGKVRPFRPFAVVARRSYSLYLLHTPVGFTVLAALFDDAHLPYPLALFISLIAVAVATELAYRLVERPSIRLGRRITSSPRAARPRRA